MTPERWRQVREIFHSAVELGREERQELLASACAGDAALRREVEDLLAGDEAERSWFSRPAPEAVPELLASDPEPPRIGGRVGAHRIVGELGRGGMGTVYLAERADGEYQDRVAIKVVRRGMDTDAILARFRRERQILAHLDHPHVARLLDGGATEDGLPFLVMEHIEGTPIHRYCAARRLAASERLELFLGVCSAVEAAHRNLVIHRDLKPANILVTADGTPKLLDFGVAKLLGDPAGPVTATLGRPQWLTPEYASPEQVEGRPITTASDVYSLGVVLYELLTGRRPYHFVTGTLAEVERVVCRQQPTRPSDAVDPRTAGGFAARPARLRKRLAGDLDTIVLKALRKEPERRYGSVEQLAEDLRRHLAGRPVLARRDTVSYRAGKFVRRHWLGVLASALVAASLLAGVAAATWQAREARRQLRRAERISDFMEELFQAPDPRQARGRPVLARELLDQATAKTRRELRDLPEVKADLLTTMGVSYLFLGEYERADASLSEARDVRERLGAAAGFAETLTQLGLLRYYQDRLDEAEGLLRQALEVRRRLGRPDGREVAAIWNHLGLVRRASGDLDGAEELHRRALALRRRVLAPGDPEIAYSLNNLGMVLKARARRFHDRALALGRELESRPAWRLLAQPYRVALAAGERAYLERAAELLEEALARRRKALEEDHPEVATSLENLAGVLVALGESERAEALYRQTLAIREKVLAPDHPDLALTYNNLGGLYHRAGRYREAERLFARALALYRGALGDDHKVVAAMARNLAAAVVSQRRYEEAAALFQDALAATRRAWGDEHPKVVEILVPLAQVLSILGHEDEARELRLRADDLRRRQDG